MSRLPFGGHGPNMAKSKNWVSGNLSSYHFCDFPYNHYSKKLKLFPRVPFFNTMDVSSGQKRDFPDTVTFKVQLHEIFMESHPP